MAGFTKLTTYSITPTAAATPTNGDWPVESGLTRAAGRPLLVVFAHPLCPCSRASVAELTELLNAEQSRVSATIVFVEPELLGSDPSTNALWKAASAIPNTRIVVDSSNSISHAFGAQSSGQTFLYDAAGNLRFSGGVTVARGERGDNAGITAIRNLLSQPPANPNEHHPVVHTHVFGCSLE